MSFRKFNKVVTKDLIIELLNNPESQRYGSTGIIYDDISTLNLMEIAIKSFNTIAGRDVYMHKPYRLEEGVEYVVSYLEKTTSGPLLTYWDVNYMSALDKIKQDYKNVSLEVNVKMTGIIAREAKKKGGLISENTDTGIMIRVKGASSLYAKITQSLIKKEYCFKANKKELTTNTARVYCSMLKRDFFNKCTTASSGEDTVIYFGYETADVVFENKLIDLIFEHTKLNYDRSKNKTVLELIKTVPRIPINSEPEYLMKSVYAESEPEDDEEELPIYKEYGYDTQEEYDDYLAGIAKAAEEWQEDEGIDTEPEDDDF